jgi:hypothetical protein
MKLKYTYTLYNLNVRVSKRKQIALEGWLIELRNPLKKEKLKDCIVCQMTKEIKPSKEMKNVFINLSNGLVPNNSTPLKINLENKNKFKDKHIPSMEEMPKKFQDYIESETKTKHEILRKLLFFIKWRFNISGNINFSFRDSVYILDSNKEYPIPHSITCEIEVISKYDLSKIKINDIKEVYKIQTETPSSFDLLMYAESLVKVDIRAAFFQICSSLEIGVKEFLSKTVPNLKEFFYDIPSPPLNKILNNIKKIDSKNNYDGYTLIPKSCIKKVEEMIEKRNKLIHAGTVNITKKYVNDSIKFVRNMLYLLYYYTGFDWAIELLSDNFKNELDSFVKSELQKNEN